MITRIRLMRVKHWIKNLLLFFPIVFSGQLLNKFLCLKVMIGFFAFSFVASIIYIFNDLKDIEMDKRNTVKQKRPLASGAITKSEAYIWIGILSASVCVIYYLAELELRFWLCLVCYLFINIGYSIGMKNIPIADIAILSAGYLLRLYAGGELAGVGVSEWMFLTVMAASFYLGFGKRRNEQLRYGDKGRKILKMYTMGFLDKGMQMFLTLTVVFYALCCADKNTDVARGGVNLLWSVLVVVLVLLRYNMLLEGDDDGDPVEVLQRDRVLIMMIVFYAISVLLLIYAGGGGKTEFYDHYNGFNTVKLHTVYHAIGQIKK